MSSFNYNAPVELFVNNGRQKQRSMTCKQFDRAADAIRHVSEELLTSNVRSPVIEVNEVRYGHSEILDLYKATAYPLSRK